MRQFLVPIEPFENGYIPRWSYRTLDAYIWHDPMQPRSRRWRLRVTRDNGRDTFSNHPTLRAARITCGVKLGLVGWEGAA